MKENQTQLEYVTKSLFKKKRQKSSSLDSRVYNFFRVFVNLYVSIFFFFWSKYVSILLANTIIFPWCITYICVLHKLIYHNRYDFFKLILFYAFDVSCQTSVGTLTIDMHQWYQYICF